MPFNSKDSLLYRYMYKNIFLYHYRMFLPLSDVFVVHGEDLNMVSQYGAIDKSCTAFKMYEPEKVMCIFITGRFENYILSFIN